MDALLAGNERAFIDLIEGYQGILLRTAEGRGSLRSWLLSIVCNRARTLARREGRSVFVAAVEAESEGGASVLPERFTPSGDWERGPRRWDEDTPERLLRIAHVRTALKVAFARLPPGQRAVVTLRDVEGLSAEEARSALGLSEANQRVLLHRARSQLRALLENYADGI